VALRRDGQNAQLRGHWACEAIVRAVTGLGGSLGIATTAEGVETAAQLERLRAEGCDEAQGFHLGRPVPADQVADLLAGRRPDPGPRAAAA
jgi:EAL domain-containing protein (putative c-di-GMP-specific phosphodiesterase class I)